MCNFGPVRTPWGLTRGLGPKILIFLVCVPEAQLWSCGIHCLDRHVQVLSSEDVWGPWKGAKCPKISQSCCLFSSQGICTRQLIMVLSCWVCGPVVPVHVWSGLNTWSPTREHGPKTVFLLFCKFTPLGPHYGLAWLKHYVVMFHNVQW